MMVFDYKCYTCGCVEERFVNSHERDCQLCNKCSIGLMKRLVPGVSFKVKGYNDKNGYSLKK